MQEVRVTVPDRARLLARREALKTRIELDRRLVLIQPLIDMLNEGGVAFTLDASKRNHFSGWPVVGSQIDWPAVSGASYIATFSDGERDAAVRTFLFCFSSPGERVDIILSNGDAPVVSLLSGDLAAVSGPILSSQISIYLAAADERWLIENFEGRGVWGGVAPLGLDG